MKTSKKVTITVLFALGVSPAIFAGEVSGDTAQRVSAGIVLNNRAAAMSASGRMAEAETLAGQSLRILEESFPPDNPILLRPLHILATARFEQGKTAGARQALKRMQAIHIERAEDRALVHGTTAVLLHAEGRHEEAEAEYLVAFSAWEAAGRGESADAASVLNFLGALYLEEGRFDDAHHALDRAVAIFATAKDTIPMDRIKILNVRAVLHARQGEWRDAEEKLRKAVSIADRETHMDPEELAPVLANLAAVLRKNHRRREARSLETRAAALRRQSVPAAIVDVTELHAPSRYSTK